MEGMRMTASWDNEAVTLEHVPLERNMLFGRIPPISASLPRKCRNCVICAFTWEGYSFCAWMSASTRDAKGAIMPTNAALEDVHRDAEYFEYSKAADPIGLGL